jgi:replicative DNA helicase
MDKVAKKTLEKLPPHDLDAEQSVLGAILIDNEALYKALELLRPEDFYHPPHSKIFESMITLSEREEVIDFLTLKNELERRGQLEEVGGPPYIAALVDVVPTAANVEFHARIVHEKSVARRLLQAAIQIATRCYDDSEEVDQLVEDAERLIFEISETRVREGFSPLKEVIKESFKTIESLYDKKGFITGIPTGFIELDRLTSGLQPSDLIIVAARPAMGKSSFCLNVAQHVGVRERIPTAIFSLEMSKEQLGIRLLCGEARIDSHRVRTGYVAREDWPRLSAAAETLSAAPIYIDDTPAISVLEMRAKARRLKAEHGLGLIIVDYLQLVRSTKRHENRQQEVTEISRSLKALAKELNVPVIALSQLSRAVETRSDRRPQLSDLRESGSLEQDSDVVLFIYRPDAYDPEEQEGIAEIIIGKQRNGPVGTVQLAFIKEYTRFENLETSHRNNEGQPF